MKILKDRERHNYLDCSMGNNKYQNAKIYRIADFGYTKFYYGSTIEKLYNRISHHRAHYKRFKDGKFNNLSVFLLFDEYGVENCKIELVENFPCESKEELNKREGWYIQNNDCVNRVVAGRTPMELRDIKADEKRQYDIHYRQEHKDRKRQTGILYRKSNYDEIKAKKTEPILCQVCNCYIQRVVKAKHERTIKHLQNLDKSALSEQHNN